MTGSQAPEPARWAGLLPAMVLPFAGALVYFALLPPGPRAQAIYSLVKLFTLLWPFVWVLACERRRLPRLAALRDLRHLRALGPGLLSGLLIGAVIVGAYAAGFAGWLEPHLPMLRLRVAGLGLGRPEAFIAFAAFLSLVHSLIEEVYWRWFVYGGLRTRMSTRAAVPLAAAAFGAHHVVILWVFFGPLAGLLLGGLAVGIGGAIWCVLYQRSGSLTGAWLSHALVDVAVLSVGYRMLMPGG